jgi:hypothetical protein
MSDLTALLEENERLNLAWLLAKAKARKADIAARKLREIEEKAYDAFMESHHRIVFAGKHSAGGTRQ